VRKVDSEATEAVLVHDYLGRLHAAGWGLPPARRDELVAEVREHIDEALRAQRQAGQHGEAVVRNVLERLGPPEEIVRAENEGQPYDVAGAATSVRAPFGAPGNPATAYRTASLWGPVEIGAVLMLTLGVLMPVIGLIIGLVLVWVSGQWTRHQKTVATALGLFPALGLLSLRLTGL
jgi:uncharacterized membrane protein